jgi:HEPN domain-containing protein
MEIRAMTGYTHAKQLADAGAWYDRALSFHEAAIVLHDAQDRIKTGFRVFLFNAAISVELVIKAILVTEGKSIPFDHRIRDLANAAKVSLDADQMHTLGFFSEIIVWLGRYPAPTTEQQWDQFHDNVFEQHKVRSSRNNVYTVAATARKFPTKENCMKIWSACAAKYGNERFERSGAGATGD